MERSLNHPNFDGPESERPVGDDLVWTAYQYTADELPAPAARAFEASLETDQQAREALSEAVALGETIRAALGPMPLAPSAVMPASVVAGSMSAATAGGSGSTSYGWGSAAAWVALGAAACLALTMALPSTPHGNSPAPTASAPNAQAQNMQGHNTQGHNTQGHNTPSPAGVAGVAVDSPADHHLLAVLWPEGAADVSTDASTETDVAADVEPTMVDDLADDAAYEPMPEATAPDWLIAAVVEAGAPVNE